MTIFGWITVVIWIILATSPKTEQTPARLFAFFMAFGTLVWGTGSL